MAKTSKSKRFAPRGLTILYEDRDLLVINKDPGVLSCHTVKRESFTAENVLTEYLKKGAPASRKQAFLVHRLDRDTSGVMLFAKSREMQQNLKNDWPATEKLYLSAVYGHPRERAGIFSSHLAENTDFRVYSIRDPEQGRFAQTEYRVIGETDTLTLVKIRLLTGRKNQIRVHFAEQGMPVVGDTKYNPRDSFSTRLCLHSKSIAFNHPFSGERFFFETEIPTVFMQLAKGFRETDWADA